MTIRADDPRAAQEVLPFGSDGETMLRRYHQWTWDERWFARRRPGGAGEGPAKPNEQLRADKAQPAVGRAWPFEAFHQRERRPEWQVESRFLRRSGRRVRLDPRVAVALLILPLGTGLYRLAKSPGFCMLPWVTTRAAPDRRASTWDSLPAVTSNRS